MLPILQTKIGGLTHETIHTMSNFSYSTIIKIKEKNFKQYVDDFEDEHEVYVRQCLEDVEGIDILNQLMSNPFYLSEKFCYDILQLHFIGILEVW